MPSSIASETKSPRAEARTGPAFRRFVIGPSCTHVGRATHSSEMVIGQQELHLCRSRYAWCFPGAVAINNFGRSVRALVSPPGWCCADPGLPGSQACRALDQFEVAPPRRHNIVSSVIGQTAAKNSPAPQPGPLGSTDVGCLLAHCRVFDCPVRRKRYYAISAPDGYIGF